MPALPVVVLGILRLIVLVLALFLVSVGLLAYRTSTSTRRKYVFAGFEFLGIGVGLSMLGTFIEHSQVLFGIAEAVLFIVGFSTLFASFLE